MTWDARAAADMVDDYARVVRDTAGVTRHERVYAAGLVIAAAAIGTAPTILEAYAQVLHVRAHLPHSRITGPTTGDLDELHRGLAKGLDLIGYERAHKMTGNGTSPGEVFSPPPAAHTPEDDVDYSGEDLGPPAPWLHEAGTEVGMVDEAPAGEDD